MAEEGDDQEKQKTRRKSVWMMRLSVGMSSRVKEVNTWFVISAGALVLLSFSGRMGAGLEDTLRNLIANSYRINTSGGDLLAVMQDLLIAVLSAIGVPFLLIALAALAGNIIQHRFVWSAEGITPKLSKVSPIAGLKRLFSKQAIANFAKGLAKLIIVGTVIVVVLWPQRLMLEGLVRRDPSEILDISKSLSMQVLGAVVAVLAIVAAADYFFQYRQWFERQKMSLHDVKEEYKQTEGDPAIKGRIRQLRQSRMRKRMMAAVPTASVIVTNPTHYAVALRYERGMAAPICVAKGLDLIALKIREVATAHQVPIVENRPLARALHASVEIDDEIPVDHYQAVAEVIGYVMRLKQGLGGGARPQ